MKLSSLNSLINGFNQGYRTVSDIRRDEEDRQFVSMQRARAKKQWDDADQLQADLRMAADPADVRPTMQKADTQDNRDVGMPGEAAPVQNGFNVKGQQFASMADATKARDAHNAPDSISARMSSAFMKAGRPVEAQQLRAGARQEKVAELQFANLLQDQQRTAAFRAVGSALQKGGWAAVPKIYENYDDGHTARVEEDGKGGATVYQLDGAGKEVGKRRFASLGEFFGNAVAAYDPKLWLDRQDRQFTEQQSTKQLDATIAHQAGMLKIAQQNANTQEQYRRDQLGLMRDKLEAGRKDPLAKMSEADRLTLSDLNKKAEFINQQITKARAEGNWQEGSPNAKALQTEMAALSMQARAITGKYIKDDGPADPLGLRTDGPAPAPTPGAAIAPRAPGATAAPQKAPPAAPATPEAAVGRVLGSGNESEAQVLASFGTSLRALENGLRQAIKSGASPEELQGHAQAVQAARTALNQQLNKHGTQNRAAILQALGVSA
jgi:hypothetical protein